MLSTYRQEAKEKSKITVLGSSDVLVKDSGYFNQAFYKVKFYFIFNVNSPRPLLYKESSPNILFTFLLQLKI